MEKTFYNLKNSRIVRVICDQISDMNPVLVGLLTNLSWLIVIGLVVCAFAVTMVIGLALIVFAYVFIGFFPFGIGIGALCVGMQVGIWKNFNDKLDTSYIVKRSVKMWCLAALLGCIALMFFPVQRHLLFESINFRLNADDGSIVGLRILAIGWMIIGAIKATKLFRLIPKAYRRVKRDLAKTGMNSIEKCAELKSFLPE